MPSVNEVLEPFGKRAMVILLRSSVFISVTDPVLPGVPWHPGLVICVAVALTPSTGTVRPSAAGIPHHLGCDCVICCTVSNGFPTSLNLDLFLVCSCMIISSCADRRVFLCLSLL